MASIVICGSKTFAQQALVNQTVENTPKDWIIMVDNQRGPARWAAARARGLNRAVEVMDIDWQQHDTCKCAPDAPYCRMAPLRVAQAMMLHSPNGVVWFDDGSFTPPIVRLARGAGIEVIVVHGRGMSTEAARVESAAASENYAMAEWRRDEGDERERLHEQGYHLIEADVVNPEAWIEAEPFVEDTEREQWGDNLHRDRYADRRLPDRFNDPECLINIEDYTMDELRVIDTAHDGNPWWGRIIDRCIEAERPITPRMFEALSKARVVA